MSLNERAMHLADELARRAAEHQIGVSTLAGTRILDCGGAFPGSLSAGLAMARICLAGHAEVQLVPGSGAAGVPFPEVQVVSDQPVLACLASQYAGWAINVGKFFAMGSGPMRAAYGQEKLFADIPGREPDAPCAVGVLESKYHPTEDVITYLVGKLPTSVEKLTLLVAPASSIVGTIQVVARSLETALHKMHELKFDLRQVLAGHGVAPLPPVAAEELTAIGWTNDAILYGARVAIWLRGDDDQIAELGPKIPSSASADHGASFAELFARYGDFYKIDPLLFSPAQVTLFNVKSGRVHVFGRTEPQILRRSFGLEEG